MALIVLPSLLFPPIKGGKNRIFEHRLFSRLWQDLETNTVASEKIGEQMVLMLRKSGFTPIR